MPEQHDSALTQKQYDADRALTESKHAASEKRRDGYETNLGSEERENREAYTDASDSRTEDRADQRQDAASVRQEAHSDAAETRRDEQEQRSIARLVQGNRRSLQLTGLILLLFLIDFFWSSHIATMAAASRAQIQQQAIAAEQRAISAACNFWEPLTPLPVTIVPPASKPTRLSVSLITGARESYAGQCQGHGHPPVPAPDPSLVKWAAIYHLPVAR